jgi:putative transposase
MAVLRRDVFRSRLSMQIEILALRHQLGVYQRTAKRPPIRPADRILWSWLSRHWSRWREVLVFGQPETVLAWRRRKFFVVPTVRNQVLFVFLLLAQDRRRVLHFNVTANPTAAWTAQQVVEALPWQDPPKYLLRDRDKIYGQIFRRRVTAMGFKEILIAPHSPWQNPFVERLIGSIRRECLDHVIVINERHLRRILASYFGYYHSWRTHRALGMDCPEHRPVHAVDRGRLIEVPEVGGLHHHYERRAA